MSCYGGIGGGENSDDQSNKVTGGSKETVSLPAGLNNLDTTGITDQPAIDNSEMDDRIKKLEELKKLTSENIELLEETMELSRKNQASLLILACVQAENQKLMEQVVTQTKMTNTTLAMQSELYAKMLGASKSVGTDCKTANPPDTTLKLGEKRLLEQEEISDTEMNKAQKLKSEEDRRE